MWLDINIIYKMFYSYVRYILVLDNDIWKEDIMSTVKLYMGALRAAYIDGIAPIIIFK